MSSTTGCNWSFRSGDAISSETVFDVGNLLVDLLVEAVAGHVFQFPSGERACQHVIAVVLLNGHRTSDPTQNGDESKSVSTPFKSISVSASTAVASVCTPCRSTNTVLKAEYRDSPAL